MNKKKEDFKMKQKVLAAVLACTMVGGMMATVSADEGLKIGYTVQSMENAYFVSIVDGMKKAANERGIDLIVADAAADP